MKILVLNGSPRINGNTSKLVAGFVEGAKEKGHDIKVIQVGNKNIRGCMSCEYCHTKGNGKCAIQDDMQGIYPDIMEADMIVYASPVYYFSFTGQLQSAITRIYSINKPAKAKKSAMILTSYSPNVYRAMSEQYKYLCNYFGTEDMGVKTYLEATENAVKELKEFGLSL